MGNNTKNGIQMVDCYRNKLLKNEIHENGADGIRVARSEENMISENEIWNNSKYGVLILDFSNTNTITYNVIRYCELGGINLYEGQNNLITANILIGNHNFNAWDNGEDTIWAGNAYSDYRGSDLDGDGFGDVPYVIHGRRDAISIDPGPVIIMAGAS